MDISIYPTDEPIGFWAFMYHLPVVIICCGWFWALNVTIAAGYKPGQQNRAPANHNDYLMMPSIVVSTVHALVLGLAASFGAVSTHLRDAGTWTFSYFVMDLIMTPGVYWRAHPSMVFHHLLGIAAGLICLTGSLSLGPLANALSLMELTTIPLNYKWFAKLVGDHDGVHLARQAFKTGFVVIRMLIAPGLAMYALDQLEDPGFAVQAVTCCLIGIQYIWGCKLIHKK